MQYLFNKAAFVFLEHPNDCKMNTVAPRWGWS